MCMRVVSVFRWWAVGVLMALLALSCCAFPLSAYSQNQGALTLRAKDAGDDTTAPKLTSARAVSAAVEKPGTFELELGVEEEETGISEISVSLKSEFLANGSGSARNTAYETFSFNPVRYTGTIMLEVPIQQVARSGSWSVLNIELVDQAGNSVQYVASGDRLVEYGYRDTGEAIDRSVAGIDFVVAGPDAEAIAPQVVSVSHAAPGVNKPGEAIVRMRVKDDDSGVVSVTVVYTNEKTSKTAVGEAKLEDPVKDGFVTVQIPIGKDDPAGAYVISDIYLDDAAGNQTLYSWGDDGKYKSTKNLVTYDLGGEDVLDASAAEFVVVGPDNDVTCPELTKVSMAESGKTVAKPGVVHVDVAFVEEDSGVQEIGTILESDDGVRRTERTWWDGGNAIKTGKKTLAVPIPADAPNGAWHLQRLWLLDKAENWHVFEFDGTALQESKYGEETGASIPTIRFSVKDEFDYAFNSALSNPSLVRMLKGMADGKAARVLVDGDCVLKAAAFDAIRGTGKRIVCYRGAYQWIFRGEDIVEASKDVDLSLSLETLDGSTYGTGEKSVQLTFAPNGKLPGKAQVRFKSDYLYEFQDVAGALHLYYDDFGQMVEEKTSVDLVFDGTDKWCYLDIAHNSRFVVSPKALKTNVRVSGLKAKYAYTGKPIKPAPEVVVNGRTLKKGADYTLAYAKNRDVGTATVKVVFKGAYKKVKALKRAFKIVAAANKVTVKPASVKKRLKAGTVKKKAQLVELPELSAKFGKPAWKVVKNDKKKALSLVGDKVRVQKRAKPGTYTMKLKGVVAKSRSYAAASSKTVAVKVTIK